MESELPRKSPTGAQLGLGVRSAALYVSERQQSNGSESKWLGACDDQLAVDLSKLCVSNKRCIINDRAARTPSNDEIDDDDDILSSDDEEMDEEANEHWREVLLSRLNWDRLSPVIPPNLQYFKDVEFDDEHMYDVKQNQVKSPLDFVPENLISDLTRSDLVSPTRNKGKPNAKGSISYDPAVGSLLITGAVQTIPDLRNNYNQHHIIAFSCGKTNSILKIGLLEYTSPSSLTEQIRQVASIQLGSTIKGIKLPEYSSMLDRRSDLIGVMTESALHVIKIECITSRMEIKTSVCEPLPFQDFSDFPFADFAFNPWDLQQFAVIDVKGNFGIGRLPKSFKIGHKARILRESGGSIFDPEELSNWKKIEWSSSFSRLLVMDRSKMIELDFRQDWQLEVIQSKTWSRLLDYQRLDDDYGILLTSREIIVISTKQTSEHISREVSWKHDLDPNDSTLRFCIRKVNSGGKKLLLVSIFSRNHSFLYIHPFLMNGDESLIQSAGSSTILQIPHIKNGLRGIWLHDSTINDLNESQKLDIFQEVCLSLFVNETDGGKLWHYILSNDSIKLENWGTYTDASRTNLSDVEIDVLWPKHMHHKLDQIKKLITFTKTDKEDTAAEDKLLQAYGYQLSEAINELLIDWNDPQESLLGTQPLIKDLVEIPHDFNLKEFGSMLSQLFNHYHDQALVFTKFDTISSPILYEKIEDLEMLYNKLLQCWDLVTPDSEILTQGVIKDVIYSCLRLWKPSLYKAKETQIFDSLSKPYRNIIGMWDDDDTDLIPSQTDTTSADYSGILASSQSQIPTIKSSQSRPAKKHRMVAAGLTTGRVSKPSSNISSLRDTGSTFSMLSSSQTSNTLPDTMTPAFTLMHPPSASLSQSQSSQRSRRKKKRVGGFG